jgi:hypothetical protein
MDTGAWLGVSSLIVSTAVLVFGLVLIKQAARKDLVDNLTRRVENCEEDHAECERERSRLTRLTMDLVLESRRLADARIEAERVVRRDGEAS